jgi:hypothetical protein
MAASTCAAKTRDSRGPEVRIDPPGLEGTLGVPPAPDRMAFAHGSGGSRLGPRDSRGAEALARAGLATLWIDLLLAEEAADRNNVRVTDRLARRVPAAIGWLRALPTVGGNDVAGLDRSCLAFAKVACGEGLEIVLPAGHLFAQPAALDPAIGPARQWFVTHLREEAAA